ncbi:hypothetical protein K458DRAFT_391382 [Lentithecium fluviatile CBS 122367]|uniref:Uncharacterized protein n=1 Tax=Lentithecium fluviatile CBS 122367 TaxID=1168545 RepID=A0A6G1IV63_9PLEO|nr:hypothetical protein K458DRAFT_391382 [Lentithecium fluviatile CBS 122367]
MTDGLFGMLQADGLVESAGSDQRQATSKGAAFVRRCTQCECGGGLSYRPLFAICHVYQRRFPSPAATASVRTRLGALTRDSGICGIPARPPPDLTSHASQCLATGLVAGACARLLLLDEPLHAAPAPSKTFRRLVPSRATICTRVPRREPAFENPQPAIRRLHYPL